MEFLHRGYIMHIALNLNSDSTSIDVIKYCALYFDNITIDRAIHIHSVDSDPNGFKVNFIPLYNYDLYLHTKILEEEGIIKYVSPAFDSLTSREHQKINKNAKTVVASNIGKLFNSGGISPVSEKDGKNSITITGNPKPTVDEALEAFKNVFSKNEVIAMIESTFGNKENSPVEFYSLLILYTGLFENILHHISVGDHIASNSDFVNYLIQKLYHNTGEFSKHYNAISNKVALNALPILLPHIKELSMDDVLDLRYHANDELLQLRNYVDSFTQSFNAETILELTPIELNSLVAQKIKPSISEFERKVKSLHLTTIQNAIRNPINYAPLLTSFFSDVPKHLAFLSSLSLVAIDTITEYRKNKNAIKNDSLYFTIKLR